MTFTEGSVTLHARTLHGLIACHTMALLYTSKYLVYVKIAVLICFYRQPVRGLNTTNKQQYDVLVTSAWKARSRSAQGTSMRTPAATTATEITPAASA